MSARSQKFMFLSAGFMLIAYAVLNEEEQGQLQTVLGLPKNFGSNFLGGGNTKTPTPKKESVSTGNTNAVKTVDFPKTRALTIDEMYSLANHVVETYQLHQTVEADLVTFAYVESSFRPWVERDEGFDKSTGLMQTLLGTAMDMYNKGYTAVGKPTENSLKDPIVSMYFGAVYLRWMKTNYYEKAHKYGDYEDFFIRAYNGGPGWQRTPNGAVNTAKYLDKWKAAKSKVGFRNAII